MLFGFLLSLSLSLSLPLSLSFSLPFTSFVDILLLFRSPILVVC